MTDNNKYERAKIYKIVCNETGNIYIGSTCESYLSKRLSKHLNNYKQYIKGKEKYRTSFKILENNNYYIELVENIPCNNINEVRKLEGEYIRKSNCVNINIAGRSKKEYKQDNIDKIKEQKKIYALNNAEKIKEQQKIYALNNTDKIKQQKKNYRENNIEKIKKYQNTIKEYRNNKNDCECGGKYTYKNKSIHLKSKKHQKYLNNI